MNHGGDGIISEVSNWDLRYEGPMILYVFESGPFIIATVTLAIASSSSVSWPVAIQK
jgi:hypothetical protein